MSRESVLPCSMPVHGHTRTPDRQNAIPDSAQDQITTALHSVKHNGLRLSISQSRRHSRRRRAGHVCRRIGREVLLQLQGSGAKHADGAGQGRRTRCLGLLGSGLRAHCCGAVAWRPGRCGKLSLSLSSKPALGRLGRTMGAFWHRFGLFVSQGRRLVLRSLMGCSVLVRLGRRCRRSLDRG